MASGGILCQGNWIPVMDSSSNLLTELSMLFDLLWTSFFPSCIMDPYPFLQLL